MSCILPNELYLAKWVVFGQMACILQIWFYLAKWVAFGQNVLYLDEWVVFGQMSCIWPNGLYVEKCQVFCEICCIWPKSQMGCSWPRWVDKIDCIWSNMFCHDGLYLVKIGCFSPDGSYLAKFFLIRQMCCICSNWLFFTNVFCIWPNGF